MEPRRAPLVCLAVGAVLVLQFVAVDPVFAAAGDLDTTFSANGIVTADFGGYEAAMGIVVQSNGRIVVTGNTDDGSIALIRYLADGTKDESYGHQGKVRTPFGLGSLSVESGASAIQADNKVVVVGSQNLQTATSCDFVVLRYTKQGALDHAFGHEGKVVTNFSGCDVANDVAIQPDGKIVAAGAQITDGGNEANFEVSRYLSNGDLDPKFDGDGKRVIDFGGYDFPEGLALQPDGKIVLVGSSGDLDILVARLRPRGTLDTSFGGGDGYATLNLGGADYAFDVAVQPDGKIVVAGSSGRGLTVVRFLSDGTLDGDFGPNGIVFVPISGEFVHAQAVTLQADGKIVTGGDVSDTELLVVRFLDDGARDSTFGTNGVVRTDLGEAVEMGYAMAIQPDGAILLAGEEGDGSDDDFVTCRYLGA
jgi:uncharacterized delta-60 repeat protein